jgi:hypothetical protein
VTAGSDCSLLEDCPAWDWLVETVVPGGRLEDPGADIVGVPCNGSVGVPHRFISPIIVAASSDFLFLFCCNEQEILWGIKMETLQWINTIATR